MTIFGIVFYKRSSAQEERGKHGRQQHEQKKNFTHKKTHIREGGVEALPTHLPQKSRSLGYPLCHMTQHEQHGQSPQNSKQKMVSSSSLMIVLARGVCWRPRAVVKNFRKEPRTFGRRARQRHTSTATFHESRRNAVAPNVAAKRDVISLVAGPRSHHPPLFLSHVPLSALVGPAPLCATGART